MVNSNKLLQRNNGAPCSPIYDMGTHKKTNKPSGNTRPLQRNNITDLLELLAPGESYESTEIHLVSVYYKAVHALNKEYKDTMYCITRTPDSFTVYRV